MKRTLYIIIAFITLCSCSSKRKIVERDNTTIETETQRTEQKNEQQTTIDYNTIVDRVIREDEELEVERIIYDTTRKDTLVPAEVIRIRRTRKTENATQITDSTKVKVVDVKEDIQEAIKSDSTVIHQKTEKSSRSATPFYLALLSIVGLIVLICCVYLFIKGKIR